MQSLNDIQMRLEYIKNTNAVLINLLDRLFHIGEYKWTSKTDDFTGWLMCDGRSMSRTEYSELFDVIGTSFGSEDADTFNLPDYRGRVLGMVGQGPGLTSRSLGANVGAETHTLGTNEMPSHTHTGTVNSAGLHAHTASSATAGAHDHTGSTGTDGSHTHTTNATGGSLGLVTADGNNTVTSTDFTPNNELNVWTPPATLTVNNAGLHTHAIASDGFHSHAITVDSGGAHTHTFTTNATGLGNAHNNMQPTVFGGYIFIYSGVY